MQEEENPRESDKQAIKLKIAGKSYSFYIQRGKEEKYRLAEREVNKCLVDVRKQNIRSWSESDHLAMAALKFAIAFIDAQLGRRVGGDDLGRLEELDGEIDAYLNSFEE